MPGRAYAARGAGARRTISSSASVRSRTDRVWWVTGPGAHYSITPLCRRGGHTTVTGTCRRLIFCDFVANVALPPPSSCGLRRVCDVLTPTG
eukprot:5324767-Prymnesium_polylepis.1